MEPISLINLLSQGSSAVLAVVIVGFIVGWITPGWAFREQRDEVARLVKKNEELQTALLDAVRITGHAVTNNSRTPQSWKDG